MRYLFLPTVTGVKLPLLCFMTLACLGGCGYHTDPQTEKALDAPVVPQGFDVKSVEDMRCPHDGSKLRLATRREFNKINDRIGSFKVRKLSDGEPYTDFVAGILIREDGKIGYSIEKHEAFIKIEDALILDEKFK